MVEFLCPKCGQDFSSKQTLDRHMKKKYSCNQGEFKCKNCNIHFNSRSSRDRHIRNGNCNGQTVTQAQLQQRLKDAEDRLKSLQHNLEDKINDDNSNCHEIIESPIIPALSSRPEWALSLNAISPKTIDDVDIQRPQVYFLIPGFLLRPFQNITGFPIKIGSTDTPYARIAQHRCDYGSAEVIDSVVCANPSATESKLKKWLTMKNCFVACKTPKKKTNETEVIVVQDHSDYERIYRKAIYFAKESDELKIQNDEMKSSIDAMASSVNDLRQQVANLLIE